MSSNERTVYLKHIERLQERNRLLSEVLADERRLRKAAYKWYEGRLRSRLWWFIDLMLMASRDKG